jgi:cytochrome c oxidase accessory protein FixG
MKVLPPEGSNPVTGREYARIEPVEGEERRVLYQKRIKIHPKRVDGTFRQLKWGMMVLLLGIYYSAPWIRWDRGPFATDQAILVDFPARRFYFFFIELWPQEVYYLTGLLVLAGIALFLVTSLFGRLWCGLGCPQTVWTDLFIWVERQIEGDRNARIKLDRAPWNLSKVAKRIFKYQVWLMISAATGGAWVFYFADAPTLAKDILTLDAPAMAWAWIGILTSTTFVLGGFAREQVCTYMCPYARFQAAMFDEDTFVVEYRTDRGEPRGSRKAGTTWDDRGHCIDCNQCVAVCPAGIDIRNGQQLQCISCGLCIDACNGVMDKMELPRGLIAYDTLANINLRKAGKPRRIRLVRPRTLIYAGLLALVGTVMMVALLSREEVEINLLRDRNPLFVTLSDGSIRNGYTFKILNKRRQEGNFVLSVDGLPGAVLSVVGVDGDPSPSVPLAVSPDKLGSYHVYVHAPRSALAGKANDLDFVMTDDSDGAQFTHAGVFRGPEK